MNLQNFTENLVKEIKETLGDNYLIHAEDIQKNNNVMLPAVIIRCQGKNVAPCIYIDDFYREYQAGDREIADIAEEILVLYRKNSVGYTFNMDWFQNYNRARLHLQGRLINTRKNEKLLQAVPHREFLDLSLTYLLEVLGPGESTGHIRVSKEHLAYWGVDEQRLYEDAIQNIEKPGNAFLQSIGTVLEQLAGPVIGADAPKCPAYILTNSSYRNGAVQMLNKQMLKSAAGILKGDFLLLPSSVHDLILMPVNQQEDRDTQARQFSAIVQEVNDTQVEEDEILSYHVYRYCRKTGEIMIAA